MAYHILLLCVMLILVGLKSQLTPIPMYHLSEIRNGIKDNPHDYEQVLLSRKMSHFWFELMLMPHDTP